MGHDRRDSWIAVGAVCVLTVAQLGLAARLDLIADEAFYWVWSGRPAWGYYDQPPGIAWVLAAVRSVLGDSTVALRSVPIGCGLIMAVALQASAGDRALAWAWSVAVPSLLWLTWFATPDALLLVAWAVALAAACRGERGWLVAGLAAGVAFECKYTGALLFPLLACAVPGDLRRPWPWLGGLLALAIAAPNLVWNAQHDWVAVGFAWSEGVAHAHPPGAAGPIVQLLGQLAIASPVIGVLGFVWCIARAPVVLRGTADRAVRIAWWTSTPVLVLFSLASIGAPPEAHWPAPAWLGIGLGLTWETGRWARAAWVGAGIGLVCSSLIAVHAVAPVARLPVDPGTRLTEGRVVASWVANWSLPDGVAARDPRASEGLRVYTERYQEAAFIHYYTGIPARVLPGCGRPGQYDLWVEPPTLQAVFVRPTTSGPPSCVSAHYVDIGAPTRRRTVDGFGRDVGPWDVFEVETIR